MNIAIPTAQIGTCEQFVDVEGKNVKRTVVITPLRITIISLNPESFKVSFGCNMWKSCSSESCSYCQAGMERQPV